MEITTETTRQLLETLCHEADIPVEKPSASLLVKLFTAVTAIQLPSNLSPLEQLSKLVSILGDEIVHAPLDHIKPEDLLRGDAEALFDLLEILTTCVHLRDDSVTTTSAEMTTAESCQTSLHSAVSSLGSSGSSSSDSLFSSESSCSTCDSASGSSSLSGSTLFSDTTQNIDVPCRLCQYLSSRSFVEVSDIEMQASQSREHDECSTAGNKVVAKVPQALPTNDPKPSHVRPSKAQRLNQNAAALVGKRLEHRRALRVAAVEASNKFRHEKLLTNDRPHLRKAFPAHNKDVIKPISVGLKPEKMPAPENGLDTHPSTSEVCDDGTATEEQARLSPHLARVLRKQYNHHLQWMTSHGASESGLKKLERDYEDLIERHTARMKQMRSEAVNQNRVALLKTQKGISQTVRNLKTHARSQASQLAHAQLETERLQRSKEAKMRLAEEKLLRETFIEAMRIQKDQLLELKRNLAEQRMREGDKHKIYMQGLEHFYRTQVDMLAEALDKEHKDGELRNSAQMALLRGMRKELKDKLDKEVAFLKDIIALETDP